MFYYIFLYYVNATHNSHCDNFVTHLSEEMMFKTIKSKFIVFLIFFLIMLVGVPVLFLLLQFKDNFKQRSEIMINTSLDLFSGSLNTCMMKEEKRVDDLVINLAKSENIKHIRLIDGNGIVKRSNKLEEKGKNIFVVSPNHLPVDFFSFKKRHVVLDEKSKVFNAIEPIKNRPQCQRCHQGDVIVFLDLDSRFTTAEIKFFTGTQHMLYLAIAALLFLSILVYWVFNKYFNNPLRSLVFAFNKLKSGDLNYKIVEKPSDEFGEIFEDYNSMVSEIKTTRDQMDEIHTEELLRADRLVKIGELAAEMAHEINNPAAVIMTRSEFLLMAAENKPELKVFKEDLDVIVNQIDRISTITGGILKNSKKLSKEFNLFNLVEVVNETEKILKPIAARRNIRIEKEIKSDPIYIYGNPQQIEQTINNLVINSMDAIFGEGEIKIVACECQKMVCLKVIDTGIGIDEQEMEKIFNPFYTSKSPDKGTGLGLYIVRNICKNHKAEIKIESEKQKGTTITVQFPIPEEK